jgi:hypothetical protein
MGGSRWVGGWVGRVSKEKKRWGEGVGSITYLLEFGRVLHNPSKTWKVNITLIILQ